MKPTHIILLAVIIFLAYCTTNRNTTTDTGIYKPVSQSLHDTIARLDSLLFNAYNTCDTNTYSAFFSEDLEFYHDGSGLTTDKGASIASYKKYVCGRVTRELLPGSLEVSPVPNFGAVEIGKHRFHNKQQPNAQSKYARFVIVWKRENKGWIVTRVISLH
ncbi:MAG TPA: nuclear transport factor 2 family protein [Chitinophagaceae bacterium]|nr:nuclear transport factor 2 family protein [Chitinophagaceae bacterium]